MRPELDDRTPSELEAAIREAVNRKTLTGPGLYHLAQLGVDIGVRKGEFERSTGVKMGAFLGGMGLIVESDPSIGPAFIRLDGEPDTIASNEAGGNPPTTQVVTSEYALPLRVAFKKTLPPNTRRFFVVKDCRFHDLQDVEDSPEAGIEIPPELIDPSIKDYNDQALTRAIERWALDSELDPAILPRHIVGLSNGSPNKTAQPQIEYSEGSGSDRKVATRYRPTIEAVLYGKYTFRNRSTALARLNQIRNFYRISAKILPKNADGVVLWIRHYDLTESETKRGLVGNFAEFYLKSRRDGTWTIAHAKRPVNDGHPQYNVLYDKKGARRKHPNWSHDFITDLDATRYQTREDADDALAWFHEQYPETTIPGDGILHSLIYRGKSKSSIAPAGIDRVSFFVDELVDGTYRIGLRDNTKRDTEPKRKQALSPLSRLEADGIREHVSSFLDLQATTEPKSISLDMRGHSTFIQSVKRIFGMTPSAESPLEVNPSQSDNIGANVSRFLFSILTHSYERREGWKLFHYTNPAGMDGIPSSGYLRLNDVRDMNDPTDVAYGISRVTTAMQGLLDDHQIQQHNFSRRVCAQVLDILDGRTKGHPYIFFTSFSEEIDTLEMWREYGNKGQGYALRFERMKLMRGAPKRAILEKVIYHPQKVEEALDAFTESLAAILLGVDGVNFDAILIDNVTSYVSRSCWAMAAMIKHQAYRNEKEWRMVRICDSDEDYKSVVSGHNDRGLKPHFKGPQVSESGLEAVYLGSGLDKIQERDLRVKLDNLGITGLDLIWSTIPLKGRGT